MKPLTVSFLVPDISAPSIAIAVRFAEMLRGHYSTEIIGPDLGMGVCSMYKRVTSCRGVPCPHIYRIPDFWWERRSLGKAITGDIIFSIKAFAHTLPVALQEKVRRGARVIAYLDEWDGAICHDMTWSVYLRELLKNVMYPLSTPYYPFVERQLGRADTVVSSTSFLQKRFGGSVIPLGVDTDFFKLQSRDETAALKKDLGLSKYKLIVFGGVPRPHKGIELILDAMLRIPQHHLHLLVVGPQTEYLRRLMADPRYAGLVSCQGSAMGEKSDTDADKHAQMPLYLSMADLIVLPQVDSSLAQSQMPCKLFEAMAMAKPIIATAVSDLPLVLNDCGWIVPPEDSIALAHRMDWILINGDDARQVGLLARQRCLERYSVKRVSQDLCALIGNLEKERQAQKDG